MKIILDWRMLGPAQGGIGRYQAELLKNLGAIDQDNQYLVLVNHKTDLDLPHNFVIKTCKFRWYSLAEQFLLPIILWRLKPDLVHFGHFNVPILYRGKFVVTIHDLIMTKFPSRKSTTLNYFTFIFKRWAYNLTIKSAVQRAAAIIAVSEFTKQDIISYFRLKPTASAKIQVIYEGLSILNGLDATQKFNLPAKYFLYVGNAYPHKNLEFLFQAFKEFLKNQPDYYLVLVGNKNYFYQRLEAYAKDYLADDFKQIIFTGFVPDADLPKIYQQATAYIFPSLYEGFGLPPLEAMFYNLPVLSSSSSCLPEILGDSALYFDPQKIADLLAKMELIIKDNDLRNKLIHSGQSLIKKYTWVQAAQATLQLYKSLK